MKSDMSTAISVVLIVRNTAPWLKACLDSIAAQSFRDFEVVIIDVASNLRTKMVLAWYSRQLGSVRLIRQQHNTGGANAGNLGIRSARGEFVFLMDSDDVLPADALRSLHDAAVRDSLDVAIGRPLTIIGRSIKNMRYRADMITWAKALVTEDVRNEPQLTMAPYYWGRLYRREMLLEHDVFMRPGRLFADRYFTSKALKASRRTGVVLDNTYFWRRDRASRAKTRSITQRADNPDVLRDRIESFAEVEALFQDPAYAGVLDYVRLSNLMRLFIHTRHVVTDERLLSGLIDHVLPYARSFTPEQVFGCDFLLARHKVQWQLIVDERWSDLIALNSADPPTPRPTGGAQETLDYGDRFAGLPEASCTQFRSKIEEVHARLVSSSENHGAHALEVRGTIPEGMTIEPLHVVFKGTRPDRDVLVPVDDAIAEDGSIATTIALPAGIAPGSIPALAFAFAAYGRYCTQNVALSVPEEPS